MFLELQCYLCYNETTRIRNETNHVICYCDVDGNCADYIIWPAHVGNDTGCGARGNAGLGFICMPGGQFNMGCRGAFDCTIWAVDNNGVLFCRNDFDVQLGLGIVSEFIKGFIQTRKFQEPVGIYQDAVLGGRNCIDGINDTESFSSRTHNRRQW